jgi:hypothetical protein
LDGAAAPQLEELADDTTKRTQWTAFVRKSGVTEASPVLASTVAAITTFVKRPLEIAAPRSCPCLASARDGLERRSAA